MRDISNVKQEIINFRKTIRPERTVLRDLERTKQRYMREDLEVYFDDIVDASERIWDMLENYKEVVEALEDTNESVISHRVNDILRVLTSISVIVLPLTFLASLWGMNVGVPGEGDQTAFWIITGVMIGVLVGMVGVLPQARLVVVQCRRFARQARDRGAGAGGVGAGRRPAPPSRVVPEGDRGQRGALRGGRPVRAGDQGPRRQHPRPTS